MQNASAWRPTKFVFERGKLSATKDIRDLSPGSRLVAGLIAHSYEQAFETHASGRLLDMGCGRVPFYQAYKPYVSEIVCIDWAKSPHGTDHLDKECDLGERIPYPDGAFNTIILSDVLEHLPEPAKCWREMRRLLAPGGKAILNVPFLYWLHETPHDFYRYTEFALRRFAEDSGFTVVDLRPVGGAIEVMADILGKLLAGARLNVLAGWVQALARAFGKSRWGARVADKTGSRLPLGYFMVVENSSAIPERS